MLFEELIEARELIVKTACDELINTAFAKQTHPQDVWLVINHSFYDNTQFAFGPNDIGYSEDTHNNFIAWYVETCQANKVNFIEEQKKNTELKELAELSVNIEKSIYLKIWEADMIIKYLYQLSLLCQGINYDWYFNVPTYSRDGSKQDIIRLEIRDKLKPICPKFYNLLKDTYVPQLRNAIAHSQYSFDDRIIKYLNYSDNPKAHSGISTLTFDEWSIYFLNTILLYKSVRERFEIEMEIYCQKALSNKSLEMRITKMIKEELFPKVCLRNGKWITHTE